jgi:transposase InsO family protein
MDDILVHGKDQADHDVTLRRVLARLREAGLTLNAEKCLFSKTSLKFLGHIVDSEGVKPDPAKTAAIQKYPTPTNAHELRRLNGMLNQMARFIPDLATTNKPLRQLLKENREWMWGPPQEEAFKAIKEQLCSAQTMAHYDPGLRTVVSCDASNAGLGATLYQMQEDGTRRPVCYASRSLSETESRYATIEKEALAAIWACKKFHQYILGLPFRLETDHKPLVPLLTNKDLDKVPIRVLRMRLQLMRYAPEVCYVPGRENQTADALSRAPSREPDEREMMLVSEIEAYAKDHLYPENVTVQRLRQAQGDDPLCKTVKKHVLEGWPTYKSDAMKPLHPYWDVQAHLSVGPTGLLMYDNRMVVPHSMRVEMLDKIHSAHQGIVKCRARARRSLWWPLMSMQVKEMVDNCQTCRQYSRIPVEPLMPSTLPDRPWERVGSDLFVFKKQHYLLVVDYYSRWIEIRKLSSLTPSTVIEHLKSMFSVHGIPDVMISDNGGQYAAEEFRLFTESYGFTHVTSSPRYPRANGEAERAVATVKSILYKCSDPYLAMLSYRTTPLDNGFTPSELLMGRHLQNSVPAPVEALVKRTNPDIASKEQAQREAAKQHHDLRHRAKELPPLNAGQSVWIRDMKTNGVVRKEVSLRSYAVSTPKGTVRRNRSALIPDQPQTENNCPTGAEVPGSHSATPASQVEARSHVNTGAEVPGSPSATPASQSVNADAASKDVHAEIDVRPESIPIAISRPRRERKPPPYLSDYVTQ